ncbi:hypothetical protein KI387_037101, partial [Taxus chinensis]
MRGSKGLMKVVEERVFYGQFMAIFSHTLQPSLEEKKASVKIGELKFWHAKVNVNTTILFATIINIEMTTIQRDVTTNEDDFQLSTCIDDSLVKEGMCVHNSSIVSDFYIAFIHISNLHRDMWASSHENSVKRCANFQFVASLAHGMGSFPAPITLLLCWDQQRVRYDFGFSFYVLGNGSNHDAFTAGLAAVLKERDVVLEGKKSVHTFEVSNVIEEAEFMHVVSQFDYDQMISNIFSELKVVGVRGNDNGI